MSEIIDGVEYFDIPSLPGYVISKEGTVLAPRKRVGVDKIAGYPVIEIRYPGGGRKRIKLHRLLLETFKGPCPEGMEGCHDDGDKGNYALDNLRWDTHSANMSDNVKNKCLPKPSNTRLTPDDVLRIRLLNETGMSHSDIGNVFGVHGATIWAIISGKTWRDVT